MKSRYVFRASRAWPGARLPSLSGHSFLVASKGRLRLGVPTGGSYGILLALVLAVGFGGIGALYLVVQLLLIAGVAPFTGPWQLPLFVISFIIGFVALLILGQKAAYGIVFRVTARYPRRWQPVEVQGVHYGKLIQRIDTILDEEEVQLMVETSRRTFEEALRLASQPQEVDGRVD